MENRKRIVPTLQKSEELGSYLSKTIDNLLVKVLKILGQEVEQLAQSKGGLSTAPQTRSRTEKAQNSK